MAVLADFTVLNDERFTSSSPEAQVGSYDNPYVIPALEAGERFELGFDTGGRRNAPGLLTLMVSQLTKGSARVAIKTDLNGEVTLGRLQQSTEADRGVWRQQQFQIPTGVLTAQAGKHNTLVIGRVADDPFVVRDIAVFFHQDDD